MGTTLVLKHSRVVRSLVVIKCIITRLPKKIVKKNFDKKIWFILNPLGEMHFRFTWFICKAHAKAKTRWIRIMSVHIMFVSGWQIFFRWKAKIPFALKNTERDSIFSQKSIREQIIQGRLWGRGRRSIWFKQSCSVFQSFLSSENENYELPLVNVINCNSYFFRFIDLNI